MIRTRMLMGVLVAVTATVSARPAVAESERIRDFQVLLTVEPDGWLTVTETIRVHAAGKEIKRGIYRDIPIRYRAGAGLYMNAPLKVIGVERNGKTEPYHTAREGICRRIYIGQRDVFLAKGEHVYTLTYRIGRMIHAEGDYDELYFNGTGHYWSFPIDQAAVTVTLPDGIPINKITHRAYTGKAGQKGADYTSAIDEAGRVVFNATRRLAPGEGVTVVVTWPKGHVTVQSTTLLDFVRGNTGLAMGVIGTLGVLVYYIVAWLTVGRDPARGIIIPMFDPPEEFGPAAARYVWKMAYSKACLAATVIQLAVARFLRIDERHGEYTLVSVEGPAEKLGPIERAVGERLIEYGHSISLKQSNHAEFRDAITVLKGRLHAAYEGRLFFRNTRWFVFGLALSALTLAGIVVGMATGEGSGGASFLAVWLTLWTVGVVFLGRAVIEAWRGAAARKGHLRGSGAVSLTLFSIPFFAAEAFVLILLLKEGGVWLAPVLLLLGWLNARFCHLLKRPTAEGRAAMDHIEGFRMYLATAEQDLLNTAHPPEKTPALFERFLPYAVALDVETEWAAKFEDVLAAAQAEGGYQPTWYHGADFSRIGAGGLASSMGSSMAGALSSASVAPSSSGGGSGGGGSSGGGGGGGGGGGW